MENIRSRCEGKTNIDFSLLDIIKTKIFKRIDPESFLPNSDLLSPRV